MEPRLRRSRTEVIVAGVCGGLAEYFGIDPVLVRLIFVLITLTTGIGLVVYPVLWMVMPKGGLPLHTAPPLFPQPDHEWHQPSGALDQEPGQGEYEVRVKPQPQPAIRRPFADAAPPPQAYNFDPLTGKSLRPDTAMTGQTVSLDSDPTRLPSYVAPTEAPGQGQQPFNYGPAVPPVPRKRLRSMGIVLLGIGILALASQLNLNLDFVFPVLMIGAGILLLRRR
jgi:phage shock protein C